MFTDGMAFMCFYDAECILSVIVKFLVHLFGEGEGQGEMGERRGRGREWAGKGRYGYAGNGNAQKIAPKCNIFGIWGHPLRATAPCHTFLETS